MDLVKYRDYYYNYFFNIVDKYNLVEYKSSLFAENYKIYLTGRYSIDHVLTDNEMELHYINKDIYKQIGLLMNIIEILEKYGKT
jgi:hypothetical protein